MYTGVCHRCDSTCVPTAWRWWCHQFLLPPPLYLAPLLTLWRWRSWPRWAPCWSVCAVSVRRGPCSFTPCASTPCRCPVAWPTWSRGGSSTGTWQPGEAQRGFSRHAQPRLCFLLLTGKTATFQCRGAGACVEPLPLLHPDVYGPVQGDFGPKAAMSHSSCLRAEPGGLSSCLL